MMRALRLMQAAAVAGVLGCVPHAASAAKPTPPALTIPLEPLGFPVLQPKHMVSGGTMFSLSFVDDTHLLLTFNSKGLLPRLPDALPDDDDRFVTALLLELPTGKVLAKTVWRTRDHGQYLFPIGHHRFLLRVRNKLTVLDPLGGLANGEPFAEAPFVGFDRKIGYVAISPGGDLLAIETVPPLKPKLIGAAASAAALAKTIPGAKAEVAEEATTDRAVQIHLYRLAVEQRPDARERLVARSAGFVKAPVLINVPATAEGYLEMKKESAGVWLFDFATHDGKRLELSPFDTSCAPRPYFVSRSEFVAFGCLGGDQKAALSGFNLHGEETWITNFSGLVPFIVAAPAAGRFALSRVIATNPSGDLEFMLPGELGGQEVTVMQNFDGRILLRAQVVPLQTSAQNFDLSPDGLSLTVLHGDRIEVYALPRPTGVDLREMKRAAQDIPEKSDGRILLGGVSAPEETPVSAGKETSAPVPEPVAHKLREAKPAVSVGDVERPRQPPTLIDATHPAQPE